VLVEGGAQVPRAGIGAEPRRRSRAEAVDAVADLRPDVVLIEHYPFSKWELEAELEAVIGAARSANAGARIVCSLRDIPPRARHLSHTPDYDARVLDRLARSFDAVLVHTDPHVIRFGDHFPAVDRLSCPWYSTGVVVRPAEAPETVGGAYGVATADGPDAISFLLGVVEAFRALGTLPLHAFLPFAARDDDVGRSRAAAAGDDAVTVHEFTAEYPGYLAGAAVSVSGGGYNTLGEIVRDRSAAVVVPDPRTDDQVPRATAFARAGACDVVDGPLPDSRVLAEAIERACERGRPSPTVDLSGAPTTRAILESLVAE
jgi:predicted glycosyltransferase